MSSRASMFKGGQGLNLLFHLTMKCKGQCTYCGLYFQQEEVPNANKKLRKKLRKRHSFSVDHVIARSWGGYANEKGNLVLCCQECNNLKATLESRIEMEYRDSLLYVKVVLFEAAVLLILEDTPASETRTVLRYSRFLSEMRKAYEEHGELYEKNLAAIRKGRAKSEPKSESKPQPRTARHIPGTHVTIGELLSYRQGRDGEDPSSSSGNQGSAAGG